ASEFLIGAQTGTGHQESNTRSGWTVGGGLEYALGYGWSVKGEYLYVKFDDYTTFTTPPFGGLGLNIAPRNVKLYDNIFAAAMTKKLGESRAPQSSEVEEALGRIDPPAEGFPFG